MKIIVWTNKLSQLVHETLQGRQLTHLPTVTEYVEGRATWTGLTHQEFVALEDAAVHLGLQYDGSQESDNKLTGRDLQVAEPTGYGR